MRFIHTSDWHLGRLFHGVHLTADQAYVLDQLVDLAREARPDAMLIAGDVFDRAVPPPEAVELLNDVLSRLVLDLKIPVIVIAGNHDSPVRLGFGSEVLARSGLYIKGDIRADHEPIVIDAPDGPTAIYALPYAEPPVVREVLQTQAAIDHQTAMAARLLRLAASRRPDQAAVLLTHAFVAGGSESESERPLLVGGVGTVDDVLLSGFDFVALGHLHRPQVLGEGRIHYPGSLLKYSFSEIDDVKSVSLVELRDHRVEVQRIPLQPRQGLRRVTGLLRDILQQATVDEHSKDYLLVHLEDHGAILDAMGSLRQVYPNVLAIERSFLEVGSQAGRAPADYRRWTEIELFSAFFQQVSGEDLTPTEEQALTTIINRWRQAQRGERVETP